MVGDPPTEARAGGCSIRQPSLHVPWRIPRPRSCTASPQGAESRGGHPCQAPCRAWDVSQHSVPTLGGSGRPALPGHLARMTGILSLLVPTSPHDGPPALGTAGLWAPRVLCRWSRSESWEAHERCPGKTQRCPRQGAKPGLTKAGVRAWMGRGTQGGRSSMGVAGGRELGVCGSSYAAQRLVLAPGFGDHTQQGHVTLVPRTVMPHSRPGPQLGPGPGRAGPG